jgi:hypothetical protein
MRHQKKSAAFILSCLIFISGCYESKFPLSSSEKSHINQQLINGWQEQPKKIVNMPYRVIICKFNDHEYLILFDNDPQSHATMARGFTTTIDNIPIMNMQGIESLDPKDRTFLFFKYAVTANGNLRTWMLDADSPLLKDRTFSTQAEFYVFIKKNIHNEKLYSPVREFKPVENLKLGLSF